MITQEELKKNLRYNPDTGVFTWIKKVRGSRGIGNEAGHVVKRSGYIEIRITGKKYNAHNLAWVYMTGNAPPFEVDHENNICMDNRWCNLRLATRAQNIQNRRVNKNNKSGVKGVSWDKKSKKWAAYVGINGVKIHVGYFSDLIGAEIAVRRKRIELHGDFANHGGRNAL